MKKLATQEDFDAIYTIFMDEYVNPFMDFEIMKKALFHPIFNAYIGSLGIKSKFQSQGSGKKIMQEIIDELKHDGIKRIELLVEADNLRGIHFYKNLGFEIEGTLKNVLSGQKKTIMLMKL